MLSGDHLKVLQALLRKHEGEKLTLYLDTKGIPTIGVGRNLRDKGISREESEILLGNDIAEHYDDLLRAFGWFQSLDPVRQIALIDFHFNVGSGGILRSPKMLACLGAHNFLGAAQELLDGPWASQVGKIRSGDIAGMLKTGTV